jgi:hypothetical protein
MSKEQYASLAEELVLREVRVEVALRGFRPKVLIVITTLVDAEEFTAAEIADLYRQRWHAELDLRSLKIVLQMDHLRCKTPHRVRNEIRMHLVAYNLLRRMMAMAAVETDQVPRQISLKGTLQTLNMFLPLLTSCRCADASCEALLEGIAAHAVGNRPDRYEPRLVKRRPKNYKFFRISRQAYKERMR